jgi:hypothetical protein
MGWPRAAMLHHFGANACCRIVARQLTKIPPQHHRLLTTSGGTHMRVQRQWLWSYFTGQRAARLIPEPRLEQGIASGPG